MSTNKNSSENSKKKVTGIWRHLKHLLKDPVKTVPEAKARKKEIIQLLKISILLIVPFILSNALGFLPDSVQDIIMKISLIPTVIGMLGVVYSVFLLIIFDKITTVLKLRECTSCKEQITYGDNIEYKVLREWVKKESSTNNGTTHVTQKEIAQVEICCTCQKCGAPKKFVRQFTLATYYDGNLRSSYELETLIRGFFDGSIIQ